MYEFQIVCTCRENDCGKHFPKCLFIEDVISRWLKVYKRKNGDFKLRAQQIWINLSWNKWMVDNLTE